MNKFFCLYFFPSKMGLYFAIFQLLIITSFMRYKTVFDIQHKKEIEINILKDYQNIEKISYRSQVYSESIGDSNLRAVND